jgi:hypothetical protein
MNNEGIPVENQIKKDEIEQSIVVKKSETLTILEKQTENLVENISGEIKTNTLAESVDPTKKRLNELRTELGIPQQEVSDSPEPSLGDLYNRGFSHIETIGKEKFDRLQELGATMATGKELTDEERKEYSDLNHEFMDAPETFKRRMTETKDKIGNENQTEHPIVIVMDKEKIERLQSLNRAKELIGNLSGDEEKERAGLISEYDTAFLEYQRKMANTASSEIKFESPVEIFTENDILKWKDRTQKFKELSKAIQDGSMQAKFETVFNPISTNELKALFLKEKPVVLLQSPIDPNNSENVALVNLLKSFGVETNGKYVYDKEQVKGVMEAHADIFKDLGSNDPDEIMNILNVLGTQNGGVEKNHLAIGVLLGIPVESAKKFEHFSEEAKKGIKSQKPRGVNVYGIQWADFDDSVEGKIRQAKLKAAFELSGILEK